MDSLNLLNKAKSIAVVRTDRLGDMVLTLPLCKALKELYPEKKLAMIARSYTRTLLENCPVLDNTFYIDEYTNGIKDIFRDNKFEAVFYPRPRFDECFAGFRAGIPLRIGTAYRLYSVFMNHRVKDHRKTAEYHEAEYNVRLLSSVIGQQCGTSLVKPYVDPVALDSVHGILNQHGIEKGIPYIVIHPGSGGSSKDWPAEKFAEAAGLIAAEKDIKIIISGVEAEQESCNLVENGCREAINLCVKINLKEMTALLSGASLLMANSTGVLHIAAALGTRVIGLFPNTPSMSAKRWGPFSKNAITISPPADNKENMDNMELIVPGTVANAAIKLL